MAPISKTMLDIMERRGPRRRWVDALGHPLTILAIGALGTIAALFWLA